MIHSTLGTKRKEYCSATESTHNKNQIKVNADSERLMTHWLSVFEPGTKLNNSVFSGNMYEILKCADTFVIKKEDEDGLKKSEI